MNRPPDHQTVEATIEALERASGAIDAATEQALDAGRRDALDGLPRGRPRPWLWATATATVLALALGLAWFNGDTLEETLLAQQPMSQPPVAEPELYQEMEFYLWLSEELESE